MLVYYNINEYVMSISQANLVANFLINNPNKEFNSREIALSITEKNQEFYAEKLKNKGNYDNFIKQIVAEIGAQKNQIAKKNTGIKWRDNPRPRVWWFDPSISGVENHCITDEDKDDLITEEDYPVLIDIKKEYSEHDLYPIFESFLITEFNYHPKRIDEKTSKNVEGKYANKWLHPDIVALETLDLFWNKSVRNCVGSKYNIYSYEIKKEILKSTLRESFYQAVSNSSWANKGFLVTASIDSSEFFIMEELRILSELHGIGVILLNTENPSESEILFQARYKELDWSAINRIVEVNKDLSEFINEVSLYKQTGQVVTSRIKNY